MAVIVNLASFAGTNGNSISVADANWVKHPNFTSGDMLVYSGRARQSAAANTNAFYRSETPASANQIVEVDVYNTGAADLTPVGIAARMSTTASTFILAQFYNATIKVFKFVGGTATQIGSNITVTNPAAGATTKLRLEVSGTSPSITVGVSWGGTVVLTQTVNDTNLDAAGRVGFRCGTGTNVSDTTGWHFSSFYAADDSAAGTLPQGTTTIGTITPSSASAQVAYTYSAADQTGFEYRLNGGAAAAIGASPATISGLSPSTTYSIEIRATNASGAGAWSTAANFTTSAASDTTPPTLTGSVTFSGITQTQYTASWPTATDAVGVTGYEYQIGSTAGAWTGVGNVTSTTVTGRTAGTTETVYVRAFDADGNRSTPDISGSVTLQPIVTDGTITLAEPLKNNTGTVRANETGVKVSILSASTLAQVYQATGLTTNASGVLASITNAAIAVGTTYHVAIKTADGGVGISGPVEAT